MRSKLGVSFAVASLLALSLASAVSHNAQSIKSRPLLAPNGISHPPQFKLAAEQTGHPWQTSQMLAVDQVPKPWQTFWMGYPWQIFSAIDEHDQDLRASQTNPHELEIVAAEQTGNPWQTLAAEQIPMPWQTFWVGFPWRTLAAIDKNPQLILASQTDEGEQLLLLASQTDPHDLELMAAEGTDHPWQTIRAVDEKFENIFASQTVEGEILFLASEVNPYEPELMPAKDTSHESKQIVLATRVSLPDPELLGVQPIEDPQLRLLAAGNAEGEILFFAAQFNPHELELMAVEETGNPWQTIKAIDKAPESTVASQTDLFEPELRCATGIDPQDPELAAAEQTGHPLQGVAAINTTPALVLASQTSVGDLELLAV